MVANNDSFMSSHINNVLVKKTQNQDSSCMRGLEQVINKCQLGMNTNGGKNTTHGVMHYCVILNNSLATGIFSLLLRTLSLYQTIGSCSFNRKCRKYFSQPN